MKTTHLRWTTFLATQVLAILTLSPVPHTASAAGFPTALCRAGFIQAGPRLCISQFVQNANDFDTATRLCRNQRAYVASYGDLFYLYINTALDASYDPNGKWLGPDLSADDQALCGNRTINVNGDGDQDNFEGTCNKNDVRNYWCAHDDE